MIYGYCRISTKQQNIERQERNIKIQYPDALIIREEYTGTSMERPKWSRLVKTVKENDTIVFDEVSRMARNAEEGFLTYKDLYTKGINLIFLKEQLINTTVYRTALEGSVPMTGTIADPVLEGVNKMLLILAEQQIKIAFNQAQAEVDNLHQRTREGIETARLNGKQIGQKEGARLKIRKAAPIMKIIEKTSKDFDGHNNDRQVMAILAAEKVSWVDENGKLVETRANLSRNTFYKYKKIIRENRMKDM